MRPISRTEALLTIACAGLAALAVWGPAIGQPDHHHDFADRRVLWGLAYAMDVVSNLPLGLAGLAGALCLWRLPPRALGNVQRAMCTLFCAGLILAAAGSAWYHSGPDDAGLAMDRAGMAVAFSGLLGLAAACRISERAGALLGMAMLLVAPLAVAIWSSTGNVLPWVTLQFGGLGLVFWMALLRPRHGALDIRWSFIVLAYGCAKLLEMNDHAIFEWTGHLVSGHTLKHLMAALAASAVLLSLRTLTEPGRGAFSTARRSAA